MRRCWYIGKTRGRIKQEVKKSATNRVNFTICLGQTGAFLWGIVFDRLCLEEGDISDLGTLNLQLRSSYLALFWVRFLAVNSYQYRMLRK